MNKWNNFFKQFPLKLLAIPFLSALCVWYCLWIGFHMELRVLATIFFAGIFFAFAITMNTANVRRFQAFDEIAFLKSCVISQWLLAKNYLNEEQILALHKDMVSFFKALQGFLHQYTRKEESEQKLREIDVFFEKWIKTAEDLRKAGLASPEISRVLQWHQQMIFAFEKLLSIKENRTPKTLRFFIACALTISLFVLAPQFALYGYFGIFSASFVSLILVVLIRIQGMLEHPFGDDPDDVGFEFLERMEKRLK